MEAVPCACVFLFFAALAAASVLKSLFLALSIIAPLRDLRSMPVSDEKERMLLLPPRSPPAPCLEEWTPLLFLPAFMSSEAYVPSSESEVGNTACRGDV